MPLKHAVSDARDSFHNDLKILKDKFASMQPELAETVTDPALGVEGYLVVWNTDISKGGPLERSGKGGTRITPTVSMDEVKMLARTMALKNAAAGLPLGGAKSGLKADPDSPGFEKKYRRFVSLLKPFLHENGGVFGGFGFDIGARPVHALWACDELKSTRSFTGKPLDMGGTDYDREGIAGLGVAVAAVTALKIKGDDPARATFAIQGTGAMGAAVFRYFSEAGARLKALSDPKYDGTWTFAEPVSKALHDALAAQDAETVRVLLAKEGRHVSKNAADVLYQPVDVLFPCAVQNVITETNAGRIESRYVVEGANGPCTEDARTLMHDKGILVIPDFIANPGGIIAAFVELTSASDKKAEEAKALTRSKLADSVTRVLEIADRYDVEPQHAGMYLALSRIVPS